MAEQHLLLFDTNDERIAWEEGPKYVTPYVSYVLEDESTHYTVPPHDYSLDYLTFKIISAGTVDWRIFAYATSDYANARQIEYSLNDGNWIAFLANSGSTSATTPIDVSAGDEIRFRGQNTHYAYKAIDNPTYYHAFRGTAIYNVCGNIMSLISGDNFSADTSSDFGQFSYLFSGSKVVDASYLMLPSTTIEKEAYYAMFSGCTYLAKSPRILGTTIKEGSRGDKGSSGGSVDNMFYNCSNLSEIYFMTTTTPTASNASNFTYGVAQFGTFYKNSEATWNVVGTYGVPANWDIILV